MTTRSVAGSHDSVMVPARNSSSIGASSGSLSSRSSGATAGTTPWVSEPISSSSSWSMRSASAMTCCFSSATLTSRRPSRACRKNVRSPGVPTVPATKRSGGSKEWTTGTAPTLVSRSSGPGTTADDPDARGAAPALRRQPGQVTVVGVALQDVRRVGGQPHHGHRGRVDVEPLEQVEVQPEGVGQHGLERVAVGDRGPYGVGAVLRLDARVVAPYGLDHARGHRGHRLALGEGDAGRVALHRLPQLLASQVLEGPSLPGAVVALHQSLVAGHATGLRLRPGDRRRRLAAPLE